MSDDPGAGDEAPDLIPARMLNEFSYCPRLGYLEWVQGEFEDSSDTIHGRFVHRNVDREGGAVPAPDEPAETVHARSVYLSAPGQGLVAKIDLLEGEGKVVTPIDYKRGEAPDVTGGAWEPERVQLCAQVMILEENGYTCPGGVLYFAGSRQRIPIAIDEALRARTRELIDGFRAAAARATPPPPLVDSPKCPRCSLVSICLPDEVTFLAAAAQADADASSEEPRRLVPARHDALPLYVQKAGTRVGKNGEELEIKDRDGGTVRSRLFETSQVCVFGSVQVTTQAVQELCERSIPLCYFSSGGWFYGQTRGHDHKNVELRRLQFRAADDREVSLGLARRIVRAKIRNSRTVLRRNASGLAPEIIERMAGLAEQAQAATSAESLLGIEGTAARLYFQNLTYALKIGPEDGLGFDFAGRNRRPPKDPVNALLSLGYALLTKEMTLAVGAVGFDPLLGFYHRPRYGRPALALDLMEEFRPIIADSVVLFAVNTKVVQRDDFVRRGGAVALAAPGRARFIRAFERRMDELVTHPVFGYRISYRRILEVQARLLARHLSGEIPEFPPFLTR